MNEQQWKHQKMVEKYADKYKTDIKSANEMMRQDYLQPVGKTEIEYRDRYGKPEELKQEKTPAWKIAEEARQELNERKKNRKYSTGTEGLYKHGEL